MSKKFSVRFVGDSGDGVQLVGQQLTLVCAQGGWQVQTLPDFPAEIRAPQGTTAGVSGFQITADESPLYVCEEQVDVLVVFNPAALKTSLQILKPEGLLVWNSDSFSERDLKKAGYESMTATDIIPSSLRQVEAPMLSQTLSALSHLDMPRSQQKKAKNYYALGMVLWLLQIPVGSVLRLMQQKFKKTPALLEANQLALNAGYNYAITMELAHEAAGGSYKNEEAEQQSFQHITGIQAVTLALATMAVKTKAPMLVAGYPITPASGILHEVASLDPAFGIHLFQAEDEIAAACAALGASYAGKLAMTCTSGPGLDLKAETLGLAVMAELPLVVIDVQRAGPSTGLPTKTEQSDLLLALYGRHGEAPLPVLAATSPADTYQAVIDAFTLAIRYMTPVILLLDAYIANTSERWHMPVLEDLPIQPITYEKNAAPFARNAELARSWIEPGTSGLQHQLGGLEKGDESGRVSYSAEDHQAMVNVREQKVLGASISTPYLLFESEGATLLVISWGSTYGAVRTAIEALNHTTDKPISWLHLRQLYPLPKRALQPILARHQLIAVVELNQGQLIKQIREAFLVDAMAITQTNGQPFHVSTLIERLGALQQ